MTEKQKMTEARQEQKSRKRSKKKQTDIVEGSKKGLRNRETNIISFVFVGLFVIMIVYLCVFNIRDAKTVINNPYNKRVDNQADKVVRGDIYSADGTLLATTETDDEGNETRVYPQKKLFAHVIGYNSKTKMGVEAAENYYLLSETDNIFDQISTDLTGEKADGHNVYTTLDTTLQKAAYNALGNNKGAVIVMEPSTGKILAMVSKPDFNPNLVDEDYDEWISYDSSESVLLNRSTQGLYAPGSTFKILTTLEYMRENKDYYDDFSYVCDGSDTEEGGTTIPCADGKVHKTETLVKAFANSCNSAFSYIGAHLNTGSFRELCNSFLFNKSIPVSFEYNKSSFTLDNTSSVSEAQETAIGQGKTMMSPMHNLMIASTVANDGKMMTPYVVDYIEDAYGRVVKKYKPSVIAELMSSEEAAYLTGCMEEVIDSGTGSSMRWSSYNAAGKTGSAQYDDSSDNIHSWFVGFAPADSPSIAISVVLEGGYSGSGAQYVAKAVFDAYFNE